MRIDRRSRGQRGFSLIEIVVTLGILGLLVGIAVPLFSRTREKAELRTAANRLVGDFKQARALAASGKADIQAWGQGVRAQMAGIRFINATQYAIFVDQDTQANGGATEADIEIVDIAPGNEPFQFVGPPAQVRFKKSGTLIAPPDVDIIVRNTDTGEQRVVRISYGGKASMFL